MAKRKPVKFLGHMLRRPRPWTNDETLEGAFYIGDLRVSVQSYPRGYGGAVAQVYVTARGAVPVFSRNTGGEGSATTTPAEAIAILEASMLHVFKALGVLLDYDVED